MGHAGVFGTDGFNFGQLVAVHQFPDKVANKYINETMMDLGAGQPTIDIYLPGCSSVDILANDAGLLGIRRVASGEQNITLYFTDQLVQHIGPADLTGVDADDKEKLDKRHKDGKVSRYGPYKSDSDMPPWKGRCLSAKGKTSSKDAKDYKKVEKDVLKWPVMPK